MRWRRGTFAVACHRTDGARGSDSTRRGLVSDCGLWAVAVTWDRDINWHGYEALEFEITHRPTGCLVPTTFRHVRTAVAVAEAISAKVDANRGEWGKRRLDDGRFQLGVVEAAALDAWATRFLLAAVEHAKTRDLVAERYSHLLEEPLVDWGTVNRAIINRWSWSALEYIKRKAHRGAA